MNREVPEIFSALTQKACERPTQRDRRIAGGQMASITRTLTIAVLGLAALAVAGIYRFGGTASALAYLQGKELLPDAYTKAFGAVGVDDRPTVEFKLHNYSNRSVIAVGAHSSCTCVLTSGLPFTIPANGSAALAVRVRAKRGPGSYSETVQVITEPVRMSLRLRVKGVFR
jgi:hypothetical protein